MNKNTSTIRRKIILPIIFLIFAALGAFGLTACADESLTERDIINMDYTVAVVFDYGGGTVNEQPSIKIRLKEGVRIPDPSHDGNQLNLPVRSGYSFKNFCIAQTDEEGELIRDEAGALVPGREWNFNDIPETDVMLVAQWWENYKIVLHYGENHELSKQTLVARTADGAPTSTIASTFTAQGYTFLDYYYDEGGSDRIESVPMPLYASMFENSDDGLTLDVWGETLTGEYQVIRRARDFTTFGFGPYTNIYMYDSVDMEDIYKENLSMSFPSEYNGEFIGNGKTIANLKLDLAPEDTSDYYYGIFKTIGEEARISDIKFTNVTLNANLSNPNISQYNIGMLAGRVNTGADLKNIKIDGTIDYTVAAGYTDFEHISVHGLVGTNAALPSDCTADVNIIASKAIFSQDEYYALYVKYTEDGSNVTLGDVYGLAYKSGENYRAVRLRDEIYKDGDRYVITASNNTTVYFATIAENGNDFVTSVEETRVVYSDDTDRQYAIYFKYINDEGVIKLLDLYAMSQKIDGNTYNSIAIVGDVSYNNDIYTVTTATAVYEITVTRNKNTFTAKVVIK